MNIQEYEKVMNLSYLDYCDYLQQKYGIGLAPYFSKNWNVNPKCKRTKDGLIAHHKFEDHAIMLGNPEFAAKNPYEWQMPENIVYCDYLEHLLLHILIGEQTDARQALGLGGAVTYIIPALNNYFENGYKTYSDSYYNNLDKELFDILVNRCDVVRRKTKIALDHNEIIEKQMEDYLDNNNKALIVLGTGLGKTTTALQYLWSHKCRALVIGPNNLIKSGWEEYTDWVDTTTYQSFAKQYLTEYGDYSQYGLVILDEAHHAGYDEETDKGAKQWSKGIKHLMKIGVKVLGLTATPERSDGIKLYENLFKGCVCNGFSVEDGIEQGIIHTFSYITAYYDTDGIMEEFKECDNKELVGQLDLAINNTSSLNEILVRNMPKDTKRKGIIFIQKFEDKDDAINIIHRAFPEAECRVIHSRMNPEEVMRNRDWFENTDEGYLLSVNMISEGAHYKGVNTLIMFRRTSSYLVFAQQLGRIITLMKNEDPKAIVFDLVNNIDEIDFNNNDNKESRHSIRNIIDKLSKTEDFISGQIIIKDEARDIVECIRKIKDYEDSSWQEWEDEIIRTYYPTEGVEGCSKRINERWKQLGE